MKLQYYVLRRVRQIEEKKGISYAKTDGKLYKSLKISYVLFLVYTLAINLLFILANFLVFHGKDNFNNIKTSIITVVCGTVGLLTGLFIMKFKNQIWANSTTIVLNVLSTTFLGLTFANLMEDSLGLWGYNYSFYWRHSVPLALIAILGIWLSVIALRANIKTQKQYKKVVENLYEKYNLSADNEQVSEEQWEEFLKNYEF